MTKAQAGKQYLALAAPLNAAVNAFQASTQYSTTGPEVATKAKPVIGALNTADAALLDLAQKYPAGAPDLKALVKPDSGLIADLTDVAQINALSQSTWVQQLTQDASQERADANIVRSDLGLPQKSN
jgi:hypothetical protein